MDDGNAEFNEMMRTYGRSYLAAVYVMNVRPSHTQINTSFIPKKAKNKYGDKIATHHRFATTELDLEAHTFKDAIAKGNYVRDECFVNSIYDFYADDLLRADKKRNVITRTSILATIGKTEENVKEGLSIEDVLPFFKKHRLHVRLYDKFYKMVFKYDPPTRNHNNKTMYCLMTDGRIYTLNFDLDRIAHQDRENENDDHFKPKVSESFLQDQRGRRGKTS